MLSIILRLIFQKRFINFSMNKRCLIIFWPTPIWMLSLVANIIQRLFEHISLNHLIIQLCKGASKWNNDCYVCEISQVTVVVLVFAAKFSFNHRISYLRLKYKNSATMMKSDVSLKPLILKYSTTTSSWRNWMAMASKIYNENDHLH